MLHESPLLAEMRGFCRHVATAAALLAATTSVLGCSFIVPGSEHYVGGSGLGSADTGGPDSTIADDTSIVPDTSGDDVVVVADVADDADVPSEAQPADAGADLSDPCANTKQDSDESDVDCGGSSRCARCANGGRCASSADCASNRCHLTVCVAQDACIPGENCAVPGSDCLVGRVNCSSGTAVCEVFKAADVGVKCAAGFCDGAGACKACDTGARCIPNNPCRTGIQNCENGVSQCVDTGNLLAEGSYCGLDKICSTLGCAAANGVISRGEDAQVTTGGGVFSFASAGASVSPETVGGVAFTPDPAGRIGKGLRVTGALPPIDAVNGLYPTAGLGLRFTPLERSYDASSYQGIEFWAKADANMTLHVFLVDVLTDSEYPYCSLSSETTVVDRCFNYPRAECDILTTWTMCRLKWTDFERENWGNQGAGLGPDTKRLTIFQLNPPGNPGPDTYKFGFTVDDIRLLGTL